MLNEVALLLPHWARKPDIEAGGCHMEQVLSYLTLSAMWGHVTKFIINAELIWWPWLTLSDFSLGYICLRGKVTAAELKGYFSLQIHLGLSLWSYAPWHQNRTRGLWKTANDVMGKKRCQLHFVFFLLFLNSDREITCLEFSRFSGEGKEELVLAVLILHKKIVARTCFSVLLVLLCYC